MRKNSSLTSPLTVLIVAIAMLTVTLPAVATHNSIGGDITVVSPSEFDETTGELQPDIGDDNPYRYQFHTDLDTPRDAPSDQSGERYLPGDGEDGCTPYVGNEAAYDAALNDDTTDFTDTDFCKIGYLDHQWTTWVGHLQLMQQPDDALYAVNPDDPDCQGENAEGFSATAPVIGEEVEVVTGVGPVDQQLDFLDHALTADECQGGNHGQWIPGTLQIDINLLHAPLDRSDEGAGTPGVADATRSHSSSGSNVFGITATPYIFLFGQPHPDNPNPSGLTAGEGSFAPAPGSVAEDGIGGLGTVIGDLTNACGDRTKDCQLLTPVDTILYDRYPPQEKPDMDLDDEELDPHNFANEHRVCAFSPQFSVLNPDDRDAGNCGVNGDIVNQFVGESALGGFGIEGGPPSWLSTLPGWYQGVISITQSGEVGVRGDGGLGDFAAGAIGSDVTVNTAAAAASQSGDGMGPGVDHYIAVNPKVPDDPDHDLWCVAPNMLAEGDESLDVNDPGFYGTYQADAIDADVFVSPFLDQYRTVIDASEAAGITAATPDEIVVEEFGDTASENEEFARDQLPSEVQDALDRADYQTTPTETELAGESFTVTREAGLSCNNLGQVEILENDETIDGDLAFDVELNTVNLVGCIAPIGIPTGVCEEDRDLKDPTLLDDEELPEHASDTERGAWQPDVYSFGGVATAFLDTSPEEGMEFNGCAPSTGAASPEDDRCVWKSIWDAYNPNCSGISADSECGDTLTDRGYDIDRGVGLYGVIEMTGPIATYTTSDNPDHQADRTHVLGAEDPVATNCIVALSFDFRDKLEAILETDDLEDELCNVDGEAAVIEFGFATQSAASPGGFGSAFNIVKLAPTPDASEIGQDDQVCVTGIWSVGDDPDKLEENDEGTLVTSDTEGNLDLASGSHNEWTGCHDLAPN